MKPHQKKPSKRASEAAVRTQLRAKLGWLRGFPLGAASDGALPWLALPGLRSRAELRALRVDRELLRATTYARSSILRRFPQALPRVVGEVDAWAAQVGARLDVLKGCVHDGAPLPELDALLKAAGFRRATRARARGAPSALRPWVTARAWVHWGDDPALSAALDALDACADALEVLLAQGAALEGAPALRALGLAPAQRALLLGLRWCDWRADGAPAGALALLADPRAWQVPTRSGDFVQRLRAALQARRGGAAPAQEPVARGFPAPEPRLGLELVDLVFALPAREPERRDRVLTLVAALHGPEQLDAWEAWWARAREAERGVRRVLARREPSKAFRDDLFAQEAALEALPRPPEACGWLAAEAPRWERRRAYWLEGTLAATPAVFASCLRLLEALPASLSGRIGRGLALGAWHHELRERRSARRVRRLLEAQAALLRALAPLEDAQLSWLCGSLSGELQDAWISDALPLDRLAPTLRALEVWIRRGRRWSRHNGPFPHYHGWRLLLEAARVAPSPEAACALVEALGERASPLDPEVWRVLLRLGGAEGARCAAMARGWGAGSWPEHQVAELERLARDPEVGALLGGALADEEAKRVQRLVGWSKLLGSLDPQGQRLAWTLAPLEGAPDWRRYPEALQPALAALARHEPAAGRVAAKLLEKDVPHPERLRAELAALRVRVQAEDPARAAALRARIASLEARLTQPRPVSPARLARCAEKLARRARLAQLARCEGQLRDRLQVALEARSQADLAGWIDDDATLELVSALAALPPASRALGFRLLRARAGPRPWDLREEPANRAFLERLRAAGHDPVPWLEGVGPRALELPGGEVWTVDLEPDPLQVLRMGQPFDTCLAPGAFNFFSAVSNAADVNKRVLYVRDRAGAIRGRCLFALVRGGGLLTFRVYGHERREELTAAARAYAEELARALGVPVVPRGHVETLVASDWYDDGPVDLTGRLGFLESGSAFMQRLPGLRPAELCAALEEASGAPPTLGTLYALLQRGCFASRPELIVPLAPLLSSEGEVVDPWTRLQVVQLLIQAEERARALELLAPLIRRPRIPGDDWNASLAHAQTAECFTDLGLPERGLRLLLRTRPQGVRGWRGEHPHRLLAAARATRALRRPRKALRLYRWAREEGAEGAADAVRELEAELG